MGWLSVAYKKETMAAAVSGQVASGPVGDVHTVKRAIQKGE